MGVEIGLGERVDRVCCPAHEVVHSPLGTVGIIDLDAVAVLPEVIAHGTQAVGGLACHQRNGLQVAVDARSHKVVGAEVAYFEDSIGDDVGEGDKLARVKRRVNRHLLAGLARCKYAQKPDKDH